METIHAKIKQLKGLLSEEDIEQNSSGYNLQGDIGSGTFGQVKLAMHIDTELPVAIKVLSKQEIKQNNDFERVGREFEILMKIDHPNIIYLYEVGAVYADHRGRRILLPRNRILYWRRPRVSHSKETKA